MNTQYRKASESDIPFIAKIRSSEWATEDYWNKRITSYLNGELNPQQALPQRILYVATEEDSIVGFIAGHFTQRLGCDGELQWLNVISAYQRKGIASGLTKLLAAWFVEQKIFRICVNVDPANKKAQQFYKTLGAENINEHWLIWENINILL